jgi:hypothetical protein
VVLFFRIKGSSERSEREIFFLEGETPDHLIGAAAPQPQQLSCFVAMSERSERKKFFFEKGCRKADNRAVKPRRRIAGAVLSRSERAKRARRKIWGVTPDRGAGVSVSLAGAGLESDSKFFWNRVYGFLRSSDVGAFVRYVQPSPGLGSGRGACVIGARLGVVTCIGSVGFELGSFFPIARSRCVALPCSPAAVIAARRKS